MMWNFQSYPTTVLNEKCDILGVKTPLLHIFMGQDPLPQDRRPCIFVYTRSLTMYGNNINNNNNNNKKLW